MSATLPPGFEREHVVDALRHQLRNKATVAYFLLLDNRRNLYGGYLGAEFEAGPHISRFSSRNVEPFVSETT
jgi:hypothetical protein